MKADKRIISAATGLVFFVPALLLDKIWGIFPAYLTLYALAWAAAAWPVAVKAWRNISRGTIFDENFLMLVASIGAFAINLVFSDFETELCAPGGGEAMMDGVLVMLLYQVGEYFQALAVRRSRRNIRKLLSMRPDSAVVLRGGKETEVDPDEVEIGETTIVRAGERIAIDGIVTDGASYVDTSMITGESVPAYVKVGDEVKSGCIAVDGLLTVRTTKDAQARGRSCGQKSEAGDVHNFVCESIYSHRMRSGAHRRGNTRSHTDARTVRTGRSGVAPMDIYGAVPARRVLPVCACHKRSPHLLLGNRRSKQTRRARQRFGLFLPVRAFRDHSLR